jgi:prevent-host-death family protein
MEEIAISKFKATCLAILKRVRRTGKPIRVTRFGEPVADVIPPVLAEEAPKRWLGCMKGTVEIKGDIVGPIGSEADWEAAGE